MDRILNLMRVLEPFVRDIPCSTSMFDCLRVSYLVVVVVVVCLFVCFLIPSWHDNILSIWNEKKPQVTKNGLIELEAFISPPNFPFQFPFSFLISYLILQKV